MFNSTTTSTDDVKRWNAAAQSAHDCILKRLLGFKAAEALSVGDVKQISEWVREIAYDMASGKSGK